MTLIICARVTHGQGQGKKFASLDWVRVQILDKFGFIPYPGTLNLQMDHSTATAFRGYIKTHTGISIQSDQSECEGRCYPVQLKQITGVAVIPLIPEYPQQQLEIIAPINLREALALEDGHVIEVAFTQVH